MLLAGSMQQTACKRKLLCKMPDLGIVSIQRKHDFLALLYDDKGNEYAKHDLFQQ